MTNKYSEGAKIQIWRDGKLFAEKCFAYASDAPKHVKPFIKSQMPYLVNRKWECFIVVKHT